MKSISILGCGWLGKPLGRALVNNGYKVSGSTTQLSKMQDLKDLGIHPFLLKFDPDASADHKFFQSDILIISIPPKRKSEPPEKFMKQMENVKAATLTGSITNVVFISSTSVYTNSGGVVREEDADTDSYLGKAENLFLREAKFQTTILRFGGLVGPERNPGRFLAGKKNVSGANSPVNIIHQHDCIEIIKSILLNNVWDEIFNACATQHPTKKNFYTYASIQLGLEPPQFDASEIQDFKIVNSEKLKKQLAYTFVYDDPMTFIYPT